MDDLTGLKRNGILARLSPPDLDFFRQNMTLVDLPLRTRLAAPNAPIEHVYFLSSGFASIVTRVPRRDPIEVGIIGREGFVNISVALGTDRTPTETYMQLAGSGNRIESGVMRMAMRDSPSLRDAVHLFTHVFMIQNASTVLANGQATVHERLARWLLMAQDRNDGDVLSLTHEFLAMMLAVRRPGVTVALNTFARQGWIARERRKIVILDRPSLVVAANGHYGLAEREMMRLFGTPEQE